MYLDLNDALSFYNTQLNTYYTLWVFFFTASIGIVGFLYGNDIARESRLVKFSASFIYFMLILGNHHAIYTTDRVLKDVKISIQNAYEVNKEQPQALKVSMKSAVEKLQDSSIDLLGRVVSLFTDVFYLIMVLSVLVGIWGSGFISKTGDD